MFWEKRIRSWENKTENLPQLRGRVGKGIRKSISENSSLRKYLNSDKNLELLSRGGKRWVDKEVVVSRKREGHKNLEVPILKKWENDGMDGAQRTIGRVQNQAGAITGAKTCWAQKTIYSVLNVTLKIMGDFPGGTVIKNPAADAWDTGSIPGPRRSHVPQSS